MKLASILEQIDTKDPAVARLMDLGNKRRQQPGQDPRASITQLFNIARSNPDLIPEIIDMLVGVKDAMSQMESHVIAGIILSENVDNLSKFMNAWSKAGRPTDNDQIGKVLQNIGITWADVGKSPKQLKIPKTKKEQLRKAIATIPRQYKRTIVQKLKTIYTEFKNQS